MPSFWIESDEELVLDRYGTWLANGIEITHELTRQAFSRKIQKDDHGYYIQLAYEKKRVTVEDTAYFIRRLDGSPEKGFELRISDDTREPLNPATLEYRSGRLVCRLQRGEAARILYPAYMDLMRHLQEDAQGYYLLIQGNRIGLSG
ncbi:MAG: hypothetical protein NDJ89_00505 [Oligoflexia bacterium]|nr:hypothetical protein [Oligoflexia bacterium]